MFMLYIFFPPKSESYIILCESFICWTQCEKVLVWFLVGILVTFTARERELPYSSCIQLLLQLFHYSLNHIFDIFPSQDNLLLPYPLQYTKYGIAVKFSNIWETLLYSYSAKVNSKQQKQSSFPWMQPERQHWTQEIYLQPFASLVTLKNSVLQVNLMHIHASSSLLPYIKIILQGK